jgi:hypothetical protein
LNIHLGKVLYFLPKRVVVIWTDLFVFVGLLGNLTFLDRELEDACSGIVSCGDAGSFAAKFSAITRILAKYLHLWKYDAPCYKFSSKPHHITAKLAWYVPRSALPWLRSNRSACLKTNP